MDYLVYEYGCLPPVMGRQAALEQMLAQMTGEEGPS